MAIEISIQITEEKIILEIETDILTKITTTTTTTTTTIILIIVEI